MPKQGKRSLPKSGTWQSRRLRPVPRRRPQLPPPGTNQLIRDSAVFAAALKPQTAQPSTSPIPPSPRLASSSAGRPPPRRHSHRSALARAAGFDCDTRELFRFAGASTTAAAAQCKCRAAPLRGLPNVRRLAGRVRETGDTARGPQSDGRSEAALFLTLSPNVGITMVFVDGPKKVAVECGAFVHTDGRSRTARRRADCRVFKRIVVQGEQV
jgi:hypothetical protein